MNPVFIVLLALGVVSLLVWALTHRRSRTMDDVIVELPDEGDIKPRVSINQNPNEDPCQPLDMPDVPRYQEGGLMPKGHSIFEESDDMDCCLISRGEGPCSVVHEAMAKLSDPPAPVPPEKPTVVVITQTPKMTRADALKAANRNREAKGRLKAQKAKEALDAKEDPAKVAAACGYKTVKYMREKVRELEREGLPA